MTDEVVEKIEREFGVRPPADYVRFMRNYPKVLEDAKCKFGEGIEEAISARYFLRSFDAVIEENRILRRALPEGAAVAWPRQFFAIGSTDIGDVYVLDCVGGGSAVSLWNHEEHLVEPIADSLASFADHLIISVLEWNRINFPP